MAMAADGAAAQVWDVERLKKELQKHREVR